MTTKKKKPELARLQIKAPPVLLDAARKQAHANGETMGALARRAIAAEIGRPELETTRPRGKRPAAEKKS